MKEQRLKKIEDYVALHNMCRLDALCEEFHVSMPTIRRDIERLCEDGLISKVYGGVRSNRKEIAPTIPYLQRDIHNIAEKEYIGQLAALLIVENDTIFVDSGTTTLRLLKYTEKKNINIVTNNLNVINECLDYSHLNVITSGGELHRTTNSFVGDAAISSILDYNNSIAFLAATGASIEAGFTNSSPMETNIKKAALSKSARKYIMLDYSKWAKVSLMCFAELSQVTGIITNCKPPDEFVEYFNNHHIAMIY